MIKVENGQYLFEDAHIVWRNFAGAESMYNAAGNRNFAIVLSDEDAELLRNEHGFNIKSKPPREEGEENFNTLSVKVNFKSKKPPRLVLISYKNGERSGRTELGEDLAMILDYADIASCDIMINGYNWSFNGKTGRKAYLSMIYVNLRENALETKYADVPELDASGQPKALPPGQDPNIDDAEWYEE